MNFFSRWCQVVPIEWKTKNNLNSSSGLSLTDSKVFTIVHAANVNNKRLTIDSMMRFFLCCCLYVFFPDVNNLCGLFLTQNILRNLSHILLWWLKETTENINIFLCLSLCFTALSHNSTNLAKCKVKHSQKYPHR